MICSNKYDFQQLNELVGLTREEIELLNESPSVNSQSYLTTETSSISDHPSNKANDFQITAAGSQTPSLLPGQRFHQDLTSRRSQTPMSLSLTLPYQLNENNHNKSLTPNHLDKKIAYFRTGKIK